MSKKKKWCIKKYKKLKFRSDALYRSFWFAKLTNKFMRQGKKALVEKYVWNAFRKVKHKTKKNVIVLLFSTLMKIRPLFGFISKRIGREFKKVPIPLLPRRQIIIALKWFVDSVKLNRSSSLEKRICSELWTFTKKRPSFLRRRYIAYAVEVYQNRLNSRFRWK
jgi:ribosomal protein S7